MVRNRQVGRTATASLQSDNSRWPGYTLDVRRFDREGTKAMAKAEPDKRQFSPKEVLEDIEARMPQEVARLYHSVWADVVQVHFVWQSYAQLYGSDDSIKVLNSCASSFFARLQRSLYAELVLRIARLADPAKSGPGRRDNASFFRLADAVREAGDAALADQLKCAAETFKGTARAISVVRHRQIAHRDLNVALRVEPLLAVTSGQIEDALRCARSFMHIVEGKYLGSMTGYEHAVEAGGADHLLFWLREGIAHQECRGPGR